MIEIEGDDRLWTSNTSPLERFFLLKIITLISDEPPLTVTCCSPKGGCLM